MSNLRFEELTEKNIPDAIVVCNRSLRYDSFDPSVLQKIIFRDPNFEPGLAFVAYEDGEPIGFVAGVRLIRQPPEEVYPSVTWIKILAGVAGKENDEVEVISALCSRIEVEIRNLGGKVVRISDFMRSRLWPGIDLRYETGYYERASTQAHHPMLLLWKNSAASLKRMKPWINNTASLPFPRKKGLAPSV